MWSRLQFLALLFPLLTWEIIHTSVLGLLFFGSASLLLSYALNNLFAAFVILWPWTETAILSFIFSRWRAHEWGLEICLCGIDFGCPEGWGGVLSIFWFLASLCFAGKVVTKLSTSFFDGMNRTLLVFEFLFSLFLHNFISLIKQHFKSSFGNINGNDLFLSRFVWSSFWAHNFNS